MRPSIALIEIVFVRSRHAGDEGVGPPGPGRVAHRFRSPPKNTLA